MSRFIKILDYVEGKPEIVIAFILALLLVGLGLYIGGPWYVVEPTSVFGSPIHPDIVRVSTATLYFIPGAATLYGLITGRSRWRALGTFGMFLAYLFAFMLRVLTIGFIPVVWSFMLGLALVSGVLYIGFTRTKQ